MVFMLQRNSLMEKIDLLDGQIQYIKHADRAKAINWDMKDLDEDAEVSGSHLRVSN